MSDGHLKELLREEYRRRKDKGEKSEKGERSEKKTPKVRTDKEKEEKERKRRERERNRDKDRTDKRDLERDSERSDRSERGERIERSDRPERSERSERQERSERPERSERSDRPERSERSERPERSERVEVVPQEVVVEAPAVEVSTTEKFIFVYEDEAGVIYNDIGKMSLVEGNTVKIFPVYLSGHNENLTEEVVTFRDGKLTPMEENRDSTWLNVISSRDVNVEILPFDLDQVVVYNNRFFHCQDDLYDHLEANGCEYISVKKF